MKNLKELRIENTDFNEVNIDLLPRSLEEIRYFTSLRPNCQLNVIISQLEIVKFGFCKNCQQPNTSQN